MMLLPREAEHLDLARIRFEQPLENLDRRRLAGTVGPEQAEAFAAIDDEGQSVDGDDITVPFD
jgi:hypothetical protein